MTNKKQQRNAGRPGGKTRSINPILTRKLNSMMRRKLVWFLMVDILALVLLTGRIMAINALDGEQYKKKVLAKTQQKFGSKTIPFKRGDITDTNGTILATSQKEYRVILDCKVVNTKKGKDKPYVEPTVKAITEILGIDEKKIRSLLTEEETSESPYQIIAVHKSIKDKKKFEAYVEETKEVVNKNGKTVDEKIHDNVKGVWFEENYNRYYPMGSLACDVVGFTYDPSTADWGVEGYYSGVLSGTNGRQYGNFNSNADVEQTFIEPEDGSSISLTLDVNIQEICEKYIKEMMDGLADGPNGSHGAKNIGLVAMDPNTGAILAMASSDPYDLNNPRNLKPFYSSKAIKAMSQEDQTEKLMDIWKNYCISDAFEPGSTVKPMTVATGLEMGAVSYDETFDCDGLQEVGDRTIKCNVYPDAHGTESLRNAMKDSCNDVLMQIAEKIGIQKFVEYQQDVFNFGRKTGIDLPGEAAGITYTTSSMGEVQLATCSFGQGFTCTMIQEIAALSSVINGGYYYRPHLVEQIRNNKGHVVKNIEPVMLKQTVSEEVSTHIRDYMAAVVESDGTGKYAKVNGYSMGGKTGTAQKLPRGNGKYLVSFAGFAPLDHPQLVVYAVVDEPNVKGQSVSIYAQYLVKKVMEEALPYMNIFPDEEKEDEPYVLTIPEILQIQGEDARIKTESVDDTNVPSPPENDEKITGGNKATEDGYTNEEAGLKEEQ